VVEKPCFFESCGIPGVRFEWHEPYGQTTVTIKESQQERKTTQVTINSNPLSYTNLLSKANPEKRTKEKKILPKESPTLQVV